MVDFESNGGPYRQLLDREERVAISKWGVEVKWRQDGHPPVGIAEQLRQFADVPWGGMRMQDCICLVPMVSAPREIQAKVQTK